MPRANSTQRLRFTTYKWIGGMTEKHERALITVDVVEGDPTGLVLVWYGTGLWTWDGVEGIYSSMDEADTAVMAALTLTALV